MLSDFPVVIPINFFIWLRDEILHSWKFGILFFFVCNAILVVSSKECLSLKYNLLYGQNLLYLKITHSIFLKCINLIKRDSLGKLLKDTAISAEYLVPWIMIECFYFHDDLLLHKKPVLSSKLSTDANIAFYLDWLCKFMMFVSFWSVWTFANIGIYCYSSWNIF